MIEAFLFYRLDTLPQTKGRFQLNHELAIPFDSLGLWKLIYCAQMHSLSLKLMAYNI